MNTLTPSPFKTPRSTRAVAGSALLVGAFTFATLLARADGPKSKTNPTMETEKTQTAANANDDAELRKRLTPEQYRVTRQEGTEPPFRNAYWNNHAPGIYVDVISGEPLFASTDKFESGTGWPSFTKPLSKEAVTEKSDRAFGMVRTEARGAKSDAHLGHIFDDGPADQGGLRYCMNSASLRFVPVDKLEAEGLGRFKALFENKK